MIYNKPIPLRNICLKFLLIGVGLIIACIIFIALVSINVGFTHLQQDGFWVPILAGLLFIAGCLWLFLSFSRFIINRMKEKDIIDNI